MDQSLYRKLIGKVEIKGVLKCVTGLHIGASKENMEIGAMDSPVVRDPITQEPYVPGSSLKGKLRALLEKATPHLLPNRSGGSDTRRHECDDWMAGSSKLKDNHPGEDTLNFPGALNCPVCRLFGSTGGNGSKNRNFPARLTVRDLRLKNIEELERIDTGLRYTEWKFENAIDRISSAANPRNLERVPRGAKFKFSILYDVEDLDTMPLDMENLKLAMRLLEDDSLGGHGSRGYGQVKFKFREIEARKVGYYRGEAGRTMSVVTLEEMQALVDFLKNGKS